ncbi:MAG TPA: zeta toxin family protein, partial [Gammaproteobacteria bacterium]
NTYGSQVLGEQLDPLVAEAIEHAGYTRVRSDAAPVLISLKGASAAGKSSLRPMLKEVMRAQGIAADGYATISPDVWRRALLDYEGLGAACKYAGPLTSREVMVIDGKLDRYIRRRADRDGRVPHFLVDRFRFDSFSSEQVERVLHNTYAKYVDTMYMYFVVTAPEETVERGWRRGLERGRYKAVEDFLGHSVEAYVGMPRLLFKWLDYARPRFRYFFLDNMVPKGTFPRTIAHGTQAEMTVLDPVGLVDIERFQKINLKARSPDAVYPATADLAPERNCAFLRQCLRRIATVHFVERNSGATYLRARGGEFERVDMPAFARVLRDPECAAILRELAPELVPAIEREDATAP